MQNPSTIAAPRLALDSAFLAPAAKIATQNLGILRLLVGTPTWPAKSQNRSQKRQHLEQTGFLDS
jgi:hypothetical protein